MADFDFFAFRGGCNAVRDIAHQAPTVQALGAGEISEGQIQHGLIQPFARD